MSTFLGEIKLFAGNYAPMGWLLCQGQILNILDHEPLAALLGVTYGGNGNQTFGLPDLRGRVPMGTGSGPGLTPRVLSQVGGSEGVSLLQSQIPAHVHTIANTPSVSNNLTVIASGTLKCASTAGDTIDPSNAFPAEAKAIGGDNIYTADPAKAVSTMHSSALNIEAFVGGDVAVTIDSQCGLTGGGAQHENMQPWLCMNYIINWDGVYPQRD